MESKILYRLLTITLFIGISFSPLLLITSSCRITSEEVVDWEPVCFNTEILPVFQNSCGTTGCHDAGTAEKGYVYSSYEEIMKSIDPFFAEKSEAYKAIIGKTDLMPPHNPLPKDQRTKIWVWIQQGAEETFCQQDTFGLPVPIGVASVCFERDVLPVLRSSCGTTGCHDATTAEDGVILTSYGSVMKKNGLVKPFDPTESELYEVITKHPNDEDFMPPKPYAPLNQAAIDSIYNWIAKGALNEQCANTCDTTGTISYLANIQPVIQSNCISCHGSSNPYGGLKLTNYTETMNAIKNNNLLASVNHQTGASAMPPSYSISNCEIRTFELWAGQNYPQ